MIYGDTFTGKKEFRITSLNKINGDKIKVIFLPTGHPPGEKITDKIYHTYVPIQIANKMTTFSYKLPKKINMISTPNNSLFTTTTINTADELKKLKASKSTKQFEKHLIMDSQNLHHSNSFDIGIKGSLHTMGTETLKPELFDVPKPLKLKHWKIGNIVDYNTLQCAYKDYDITFAVLGVLYQIRKDSTGLFLCDVLAKLGAQSLITE